MELNLNSDDQDRVIHLCILDSAFLGQAIRKRIEPKHFSSDIRQKTIKTVFEFYDNYKKCPGEDIISEIDSKIKQNKIRSEDRALYDEYISNVMSIPPFSEDMIRDRLDFFVKTRIISNLSSSLLKLQDRFDIDPEKPLQLIRDAVIEADSTTGRKGAESILYDPVNSITSQDFVTKFGIERLDRQLGGGLKPGNYVVVQAYLGMGKSWLMTHLAKMAVRFGNSPLLIPTEMANNTSKVRLRMSFTGLTKDDVFEKPNQVRNQVMSSMNKGADIFLLSEEEKLMRIDELPAVIEDTETRTGKKIKLILFDSADDMAPPVGRYKSKIDENTAIHTYLKNLAKKEEICIVTTAQAQRGAETKFWLGAATVADNINKFRKATVGISINAIEKEKKRWLYRLWLFKNTDGAEGARVWVKRDYTRGQFITKFGKYDRFSYEEFMEKSPIMEKED